MPLLIVEDDRDLAASMIDYLELQNFECDYAERGDHAKALAMENHYDAIVMDVMLPGMDGITLCRELRSTSCSCPIIMLTARDTLEDKLSGFEAGADDYLVKPFDLAELAARLNALGRRTTLTSQTLSVADLCIDIDKHQVKRNGQLIELSPACWKLLIALAQASPKVLSRQELESTLWKDSPPDSEALKSHMYTLRKLVDKPFTTPLIHTLRGVGVTLREA